MKDVTERLNHVESNITRMNTGKTKLDEMLQSGRLANVKTSLEYVSKKNTNNVVSKSSNLEGLFRRINMAVLKRRG